ncbi:hypothetical protein [Trichothermofontia sp.]
MDATIDAIANLGPFKVYVGTTRTLKMAKLETGTDEHPTLQAVWPKWKQQRRFTFHTHDEVAAIADLIGREQFLQDTQTDTQTLKDRWPPLLASLEAGRYPHTARQNTWTRLAGQRNFKFHARKTLLEMRHVINIKPFFQDIHLDMAPK